MPTRIEIQQLKALLDDGAGSSTSSHEPEHAEAHLPGAVNIPLKQLNAETTARPTARTRSSSTAGSR
jgi:3-mercaptopyruvate sulfurtransferase SseA